MIASRIFISIVSFITLFNSSTTFAEAKAAKVTMLRGIVFAVTDGKKVTLKQDQWVNVGDQISTENKSFVKLLFTDKSTMNLGPNSEIEVKNFSNTQAGLINVLKGTIRAQVTKDILAKNNQSKLFLQTKTAAMGIRGTDLSITYIPSQERTSLITYEGNVAMVRLDPSQPTPYNNLEAAVSSPNSVAVKAGQFSGTSKDQERVSIPVKISPTQLASLKSNSDLKTNGHEVNKQKFRNIVPPGLSSKVAVSSGESIEKQVANASGANIVEQVKVAIDKENASTNGAGAPPPEGFKDEKTGAFAPPAGGIIDMKTGIYIAPPPGSTFDPNTQTYQVPPSYGEIDPKTGGFVPPDGLTLNDKGEFVKEITIQGPRPADISGSTDKTLAPPPPVFKLPDLASGPISDRPILTDINFGPQTYNVGELPPLPPPPAPIDEPDWENSIGDLDQCTIDPCSCDPCACGGCGEIQDKTNVHFIINVI